MSCYCAECGKQTKRMDHDELAWLGGFVCGSIAGMAALLVVLALVGLVS